MRREVREREKTEDPLAVFFYSHLFALSPRSKRLNRLSDGMCLDLL